MGFRIYMSYGDFCISHEDEMDTSDAMNSGVYFHAMRAGSMMMSQWVTSGVLNEEIDVDAEAMNIDKLAPIGDPPMAGEETPEESAGE